MAQSLTALYAGSATGGMSWVVVSTNTTAVSQMGYIVDSTLAPVTITLPASPAVGDVVGVTKAGTNTVTIARNGNLILGEADDFTLDTQGDSVSLVFTGATFGWASTTEVSAGAAIPASMFWGKVTESTLVSITAAATAVINRVHSVELTSAAATITLPAASGNSGNVVGFLIASTNTKTVTIDGNASETIDGVASLTMHKNGILLLVCDGTGWRSIVRDLAPGVHVEASSNSGQGFTSTLSSAKYEDITADSHSAYNTTTGAFTAPVDGVYSFTAYLYFASAVGFVIVCLATSATTSDLGRLNQDPSGSQRTVGGTRCIRLTAGTVIYVTVAVENTGNAFALGDLNWLCITRIGD